MELESKKCIPCRGGISPLNESEATSYLPEVAGWDLVEKATRIKRTFNFNDYLSAFDFVKGISYLAEEEGHHPDISFGWGYCTVIFYTHKIGGLHENDFIMAAKVNRLLKKSGKVG